MAPLKAKVPGRTRSAPASERSRDPARPPPADTHSRVFIDEGDHDEDRPEDLLLSDRHGVIDVGEEGRLDVPALGEIGRPPTTQRKRRPLLDALLYVAEDAVALLGR